MTGAILKKMPVLKSLFDPASYYYTLRNKLIHEQATVGVADSDIKGYRLIVERLLTTLYNLEF